MITSLNLLGPILQKEMRTASRQKRNYAMRTIYVLVMTIIVAIVWYSVVPTLTVDMTYTASMMSRAALQLIITIGIFQFVALQHTPIS